MSVRPEVVLLLGAGGIGLLALLFPLLARQAGPPAPVAWGRPGVALGVIALLFGLTRLHDYPFSPGGTLGDGLAIGGALALITAALARSAPGSAAGAVGASGGALLGTALVLLWLRGYPNAALVGFGAGHAVATLLAAGDDEVEGRSWLWAGPVMAAILAGAVLLAIDRAGQMQAAERLALDGKVWWVWPAVTLAAVLAGQMAGLSLFARRAGGYLVGGLVAALLLFLLWLRFPSYAPLMVPLAAGFVTGVMVLLCSGVQAFGRSGVQHRQEASTSTSTSTARTPEPLNARTPERLNALPAIVAPALVVVLLATAYRLYTGYGIALAALGAAVALPWLAEREPLAVGRSLFGLLAAAILFRVYYNHYDLRGSDLPLTAHYTMVSLIAGALAPFALALPQAPYTHFVGTRRRQTPVEAEQGSRSSGSASDVASPAGGWRQATGDWRLATGVSLAVAVALPVLLTLFWGQKAGGGLLLGVAMGQAFCMLAALLEPDAPGNLAAVAARAPEAALLVMAWVTVQLLDRVEAYGLQLLRLQRVGLIAALVAAGFIAILIQTRRTMPSRGGLTRSA